MIIYLIGLFLPTALVLQAMGKTEGLEPFYSNALQGYEIFTWMGLIFGLIGVFGLSLLEDKDWKKIKKVRDKENVINKFFRWISPFAAVGIIVLLGDASFFVAFTLNFFLNVYLLGRIDEHVCLENTDAKV